MGNKTTARGLRPSGAAQRENGFNRATMRTQRNALGNTPGKNDMVRPAGVRRATSQTRLQDNQDRRSKAQSEPASTEAAEKFGRGTNGRQNGFHRGGSRG